MKIDWNLDVLSESVRLIYIYDEFDLCVAGVLYYYDIRYFE